MNTPSDQKAEKVNISVRDLEAAIADFAHAKFDGGYFGSEVYEKFYCTAFIRGAAHARQEIWEAIQNDKSCTADEIDFKRIIFGESK